VMGKKNNYYLPIITIIISLLCIPLICSAEDSDNQVEIDNDLVYYGKNKASSIKSPCEIELSTVLETIPEYRKLQDENINTKDARYWVLWKRINAKLNSGYSMLARKYSYDSIGELGYIHNYPDPIPNKTSELINIISNKK
jgi:hypothetical protein